MVQLDPHPNIRNLNESNECRDTGKKKKCMLGIEKQSDREVQRENRRG